MSKSNGISYATNQREVSRGARVESPAPQVAPTGRTRGEQRARILADRARRRAERQALAVWARQGTGDVPELVERAGRRVWAATTYSREVAR